jgi:hypothetical protein
MKTTYHYILAFFVCCLAPGLQASTKRCNTERSITE